LVARKLLVMMRVAGFDDKDDGVVQLHIEDSHGTRGVVLLLPEAEELLRVFLVERAKDGAGE